MVNNSAEEGREAERAIASLISKSEKAQQRLTAGTWQHAMLRENLKALDLAGALMKGEAKNFTAQDLAKALVALGAMIDKSEKARAKFLPGTAQDTLLRNRLKALRLAEAVISTTTPTI